ncbi:hypothetical protein Agub_g3041, partial [Astrephomene gubernaculifera]
MMNLLHSMHLSDNCQITSLSNCGRAAGFRVRSNQRVISSAAAGHTSTPSSQPSSRRQPPCTTVPPIPQTINADIATARRTWQHHCINSPLVDPVTNSRVHVYGTVHYAPHGGPAGLAELQDLITSVQPTVLAIEQPFDLAARAGLPYPELIHELTSLLQTSDAALELLSGPEPDPATANTTANTHITSTPVPNASDSPFAQPTPGASADVAEEAEAERARLLARLRALLPGLAHPARVGRDLLDPYEVFGLYGGCEYVTRPAQLAEAAALFGHLPGLEVAAAALAAQQRGVQVTSVDAPLRLQEQWVGQLVADWRLQESQLTRSLQQDLARAQALLPPDYLAWDTQLAEAVRQLEAA